MISPQYPFIRSAGCLIWDYVETEKTHTEHTQTSIRTHDLSIGVGEDSSCLRPRGHCDRQTYIWSRNPRNALHITSRVCPLTCVGTQVNLVKQAMVIDIPGHEVCLVGDITQHSLLMRGWSASTLKTTFQAILIFDTLINRFCLFA
jgi:hypothetical protein